MAAADAKTGVVLQMQDYSIHDGDGVRTTIFLAGCGLRCQWCANPESWTQQTKLAHHAHKCTQCHRCADACPEGLDPAAADFDPSQCSGCGSCAAACPQLALQLACLKTGIASVAAKIRRDEIFFRHSGGGVTVSGGEPFLQHDFLREIVDVCERQGVSVWVETCGFFNWDLCKDLVPRLEHVFFDIKHMDDATHHSYTGQSNRTILENACRIRQMNVPMTIRIPLIVEVNLDETNLRVTAEFMRDHLPGCGVELLPYHTLGKAKYTAFHMEDDFHGFSTPSAEQVAWAYGIFAEYEIARA